MKQHFRGIGEPFITLSAVDSTNNYAMARIGEGPVEEGTTWFAWQQTSGKGQRGKSWQSEPGENVMLSVVLKPLMLKPSDQFMLSAMVALSVLDLIRNHTSQTSKIKWSNDLYIGDKKAAGILIENVIRGNDWHYAIVGIGLNVNQVRFPENVPNPVSLTQVTGTRYDVLEVAKELCGFLAQRYKELSPAHFSSLLSEYAASLYHLGEEQLFEASHGIFKARIGGVEKDGKLRLKKDGQWSAVDFGEVSFLIGDPPGKAT